MRDNRLEPVVPSFIPGVTLCYPFGRPSMDQLCRRTRTWSTRLCALTVASLLTSQIVDARQARPRDLDVKAAYLFNFARFTTWPPAAGAGETTVFELCVLGRDPFGPALDAMVARETIDGKPVALRRIAKPHDTTGCRIVFVSASEDAELTHILEILAGFRILTVSDLPEFVQRGGMIQFVSDGKRIRFTVNLPAATQVGLMLSSELLRVAAAVQTKPKPGA